MGRLKTVNEMSVGEWRNYSSRHSDNGGRIPRTDDPDPEPTEQELVDAGFRRPAPAPATPRENPYGEDVAAAFEDRFGGLRGKRRELGAAERSLEGAHKSRDRRAADHYRAEVDRLSREIAELTAPELPSVKDLAAQRDRVGGELDGAREDLRAYLDGGPSPWPGHGSGTVKSRLRGRVRQLEHELVRVREQISDARASGGSRS